MEDICLPYSFIILNTIIGKIRVCSQERSLVSLNASVLIQCSPTPPPTTLQPLENNVVILFLTYTHSSMACISKTFNIRTKSQS